MRRFSRVLALGCCAALTAPLSADSQEAAPSPAASRGRAALETAFPKTKDLIDHLESSAPRAHRSLLAHAEGMGRRHQRRILNFARENHSELAQLLTQLQRSDREAFDAAAEDLVDDVLRLEALAVRDPEAAALARREWSLESRLQLLSAHLSVGEDPARRKQMEAVVRELDAMQTAKLERSLQRHEQQAERIRQQLERTPEQRVAARMKTLNRRIRRKQQGN